MPWPCGKPARAVPVDLVHEDVVNRIWRENPVVGAFEPALHNDGRP